MPLTIDALNSDLQSLFCDMPQSVTVRRVGKQTFTAPAAISDIGASSMSIRAGAAGVDVSDSISITLAMTDCLWRPAVGDAIIVTGNKQTYRIVSVRSVPGDVALDVIAEVV